ncbi:MAG TPA: PEP-CTERM sorting domain-containing protein [Candidatus Acidoferrales bacterium]
MKFSRLLGTAALILSLGMTAAVAHADGADPTVKINKPVGGVDPSCADAQAADPTIVCLTQDGTATINLNQITTFDVGGTVPITSFEITFPGVVGNFYNCFSDIFTNCYSVNTGTVTELFLFMGGPGACESNGSAGGQCPGVLDPGTEFTVQGIGFPDGATATLQAPEPSTIALFLGGLIALFAFSRKRSAALQS